MRRIHSNRSGLGRRSARSGFSLIELLIVMVMLAIMLGTLGVVSITGQSAYEQTTMLNDMDSRGARALARITEELTTISGTQMNPSPATNSGSSTINYVQAIGVVGGVPAWGPNNRIGAEYETGEVDDGVDNDGDGLVDELMIVLTRDVGSASEKRVVLARGIAEWGDGEIPNNVADDNGNGVVDEQGFNLHMVGDVITLRIWMQALDAENQVVVREIQDTVRLRNAGV